MNRRRFLATSMGTGAGFCAGQAAAAVGQIAATQPADIPELNVRSFGATGDGRTDDTQAIQQAVDAGCGMLILPGGSYRLTRPIVLDLSHGFRGIRGHAGTARVIMTGPGPAFKIVGHHQGTANPSTVKNDIWESERMPIVAGFEILGRHEQADGIQLLQTMKAVLHNLLIRRCRVGVHLADRNRNFVIYGCHIYECTDTGLFLDNVNLHQANIVGNHISYNRRAGIRQLNGDVHNVQITGNDIEYNSGSDESSGEILLEAPDGTASEFTIASNTIQATLPVGGANIRIVGRPAAATLGARLIAVTGNVIGSRHTNIDVDNGERLSITGNTIYGGTTRNLRLSGCRSAIVGSNTFVSSPADAKTTRDGLLLENCLGCSIVGNIISGGRPTDDGSAACLTLQTCREISVSSCQILDPIGCGISLDNSSRCKLSDNTILDRRPARSMRAAIRLTGQCKDNLIANNALNRGTQSAIDCPKDLATLSNNTIWD